jgi:hypothetical protein
MFSTRARKASRRRSLLASWAGLGCLLVPLIAPAEQLAFEGHRVASTQELASMRGGFIGNISGKQLELSFGIERVVSIDGEIVATTRFRIPSLASLEGLRALPIQILQTGPGNQVSADVQALGANLAVIQNSLDSQVLRQVTTIEASVRNLALFRAGQLGESVNRQLVMSLR